MPIQKKLTEKDTLGFLGETAQYRIVKSLIENKQLFMEVHPYLKADLFTDKGLKEIISILNDKYDSKGFIPGYKDLEVILKDQSKTDEELAQCREAFKRLRSEELVDGMASATEIGVSFLKKKEAERILSNGLNTLKTADMDLTGLLISLKG